MEISVSIIVTKFNTPAGLYKMLISSCEQYLQTIEILCVDDGADAEATVVMQSFAAQQKCIKIIRCPEAAGPVARKQECLRQARGLYTLFLDTEGFFLLSETCEALFEKAEREEADIYHFSTMNRPCCKVYAGYASMDDLLRLAFEEEKISWEFCDKLIKTQVLKQAFKGMSDWPALDGAELVLFFRTAFFSRTYYGELGKAHLFYTPDKEPEAYAWCSAAMFEKTANKIILYNAIQGFLAEQGAAEQYACVARNIRHTIFRSVLRLWMSNELLYMDKAEALASILKHWPAGDMICGLAQWGQRDLAEHARFLPGAFPLPPLDRSNPAIAVFAEPRSFEKYAALPRCAVFFTDGRVQDAAEARQTVTLPAGGETDVFWYKQRYEAIHAAMDAKGINVCVFDSYASRYAFFDILTVKSCGAHVVVNAANIPQLNAAHRRCNPAAYMHHLSILMQANAAQVSKDACTEYFPELGINFMRGDVGLQALLDAIPQAVPPRYELPLLLYEQKLLTEKYKREAMRFQQVAGPFYPVLLKPVNIALMQRGIKLAALMEMWREASLLGKTKVLCKLALKAVGVQTQLGLYTYTPRYRPPLCAKIKKKLGFVKCMFVSPSQAVSRVKSHYRWKAQCEKRLRCGQENPDKIFYTIRLLPGNEGLLLSYLRILRELHHLEGKDYIPVIDMQWAFYLMAHNDPADKGKVNGWETYFQPVGGYSLAEAFQSKNVIRGQICYREMEDNYLRMTLMREDLPGTEDVFAQWCRLDRKYMRLQPRLEARFEEEFQAAIGDRRAIGVMVREGYSHLNKLNYALIAGHAVQPELEQVIEDIHKWLKLWNCDRVFISAEYQQTIDVMQAAFGEKLLYTRRERKNFSADSPDEYKNRRRKYYQKVSREQINIDYLKEVYFLSRCTSLVAGRASASIVAALWNGGKYEHRHIYELGSYTTDTSKPIHTLDKQQ